MYNVCYASFPNDKTKVCLLNEKLDQLSNQNIGFIAVLLLLIDTYSSHLCICLALCCNSFALSLFDKVTTGT